ncbi:putative acyl-CoA thioester hydrolase [Winogradskya consettensis]|uniref:Pectinesterase n=1 Tax=Winogradskya consettensis TaxID=113560 RepID=A0A919VZY9_9ACTN|nr:putative acyl-CoA thioester hydrolase [Actinoplanes consettensis]GIM80845.1 pectinesterase [Actinoplanes consettensis]
MSIARWITTAATVAVTALASSPAAAAGGPAAGGTAAGGTAAGGTGRPAGLTAPGTVTRPVLSRAEAAPFVPANYFGFSGPYAAPVADPWRPAPIREAPPDFVVGGRGFATVQEAVNAAFRKGGTKRLYIAIRPGTYTGTVFIPAGTPPLTIYGIGNPRLAFTVDAIITPAAWAELVNPGGSRYAQGDPAWDMFQSCATRTSTNAGLCATVVWGQSTDLQLKGLTITNTLLDTVDRGTHQALALRTDADRTQLEEMHLISRQDTFLANANDVERIARVSVRNSYIEGDTDFVFGRAAAVFDHTRFHLVSTRKPSGGVIFAPNTAPLYPYGFLVTHSLITADAGYKAAPTGFLGRAWDQGAGTTGYLPGVTPNGQLVIRNSLIGEGFTTTAPWAPAATTARPFTASIEPGRDLNDVNHNRLWEYANLMQPGATPATTSQGELRTN